MKGKRNSGGWFFGLVFILLTQVALWFFVPLQLAYTYRMDYSVIKDNLATVGTTLDLIEKEIHRKNLKDYVILIGDSIMYSGPGDPFQSVSFHMNKYASQKGLPPVFNLAIPAAQMGDFYTLLLMLDERGISTNHVIVNLTYAGFVKRDPDPPIVYWLEQDLRKLDPNAFEIVSSDLLRSKENKNRPDRLGTFLEYHVFSRIPILKYRDFIRSYIERSLGMRSWETGDARPWLEKPYLRDALKDPVYQRQFDPSPMKLDESNFNVLFLNLIAQHQTGKDLIVFMSPLNKILMKNETQNPGFIRNMDLLQGFLSGMAEKWGFDYADLTDAIPDNLFSDHMHLISDGYRQLANILWDVFPGNHTVTAINTEKRDGV